MAFTGNNLPVTACSGWTTPLQLHSAQSLELRVPVLLRTRAHQQSSDRKLITLIRKINLKINQLD